jgi:hypothetical protein
MQWRLGIFYGAVASGSGNNVQLKEANFYELPYSFSSQSAAQDAATQLSSALSGLFVSTRIWLVA